jgi:hypothetical protein
MTTTTTSVHYQLRSNTDETLHMFQGEVYVIPPTLNDYLTYYVETKQNIYDKYYKHQCGYGNEKYNEKLKELSKHFQGVLDYWKKQDKEFYNCSDYIAVPKLHRSLEKLVKECENPYWIINGNVKNVAELYL